LIRVIGVTWPKLVLYLCVIPVALVHVMNKQPNRRASSFAFEYARENFNLVGLLALRCMSRRSGAAAIEVELQIARFKVHTGWAAVDNTAERDAVAFAERRDYEILTNTVAGHLKIP